MNEQAYIDLHVHVECAVQCMVAGLRCEHLFRVISVPRMHHDLFAGTSGSRSLLVGC